MPSVGDQEPVEVELSIECSLIADSSVPGVSKQKKQKGRSFNMTTVLTVTSDLEFVDYRRIPFATPLVLPLLPSNGLPSAPRH